MDSINTYIKDQLYQSPRPGHPSRNVTEVQLKEWIAEAKRKDIRTIICLLDDRQLGYYANITSGLLQMYQQNGFIVIHRPLPDPAFDISGWDKLDQAKGGIYEDFAGSTKPVLIHCSAGQDRSPAVARYIRNRIWEG